MADNRSPDATALSMPDVQARTPDEAAGDVVWLATLPPEAAAPCGELVQYRRVIPFRS